MARQEDAKGRAPAHLRFGIDKTAGLLDDAVDGGKSETCAFTDVLRRKERLKDLVHDVMWDADANIGDLNLHVVRRRHSLVVEASAFLRANIGGSDRQSSAVRHCITRIDGEVHDHLLELRDVGPDRPKIATMHDVE